MALALLLAMDILKAFRDRKLKQERRLLQRALEATDWHLVACARRLNTPTTTLLRAINNLTVVGGIATGRRRSPGCAAHLIWRH